MLERSKTPKEILFKRLICLEIRHYAETNRIECKDVEYGTYISIVDKYNAHLLDNLLSPDQALNAAKSLCKAVQETNGIPLIAWQN